MPADDWDGQLHLPRACDHWRMDHMMQSISHLNDLAKARLQNAVEAETARLKLLNQLIRYGVCTCHCHFSTSVYHSAAPCCGNARLAKNVAR